MPSSRRIPGGGLIHSVTKYSTYNPKPRINVSYLMCEAIGLEVGDRVLVEQQGKKLIITKRPRRRAPAEK